MQTHVASRDTTLVTCWNLARTDGIVQTFTEHDQPIFIDLADGDGLLTYAASSGYSRTAISSSATFAVDNMDVEGFLDPSAFTVEDIEAGRYDFAEVRIFMVNWADPSMGIIRFRRGYLGDISENEAGFVAELRGLLERYNSIEVAGLYAPTCRADLGDQPGASPSIHGCKVRLDPPFWAALTPYTVRPPRDGGLGSVIKPLAFIDRHMKCVTAGTSGITEPSWNTTVGGTTNDGTVVWEIERALTIETSVDTVTDRGEFTVVYTGDAPDVLLTDGLAKFISGNNALINLEIKSWVLSTKTIILALPAPLDITPALESNLLLEDGSGVLLLEDGSSLLLETGDIIHLQAGCAKDRAACKGHDNIYNARAEWHVPGVKVIFRTAANQ